MSTVKKGQLARAREWWKHLRPFLKQDFWGRERAAERKMIRNEERDRGS